MSKITPETNILPEGVEIKAPISQIYQQILTMEAVTFLQKLHHHFEQRRQQLLQQRIEKQAMIDRGIMPHFLEETKEIREKEWTIRPVPADLMDRRVEITGPASDRKMVINALNSGAKAFMADFEDANAPTWANSIEGQIHMRDAVARTITFESPEGKKYQLNDKVATLIVRPRGWHLVEKHILIDGQPMSGSLVDFGLYFFHNAKKLMENGSGPYFYLPKLESHLEARLWNDIFLYSQERLGIERGTIKATVLIETILASFEMHEILYELREHSAGLNCGRWDYIFSYIKKFRNNQGFILPDRSQVTMTVPFMKAYTQLTVQTCHKRGAHAIGGMAAQIPVRNDTEANEQALQKVRVDKEREAMNGHDGTWVAHPGLVPTAMQVFDEIMPSPNQLHRTRSDVHVMAADLLEVPHGTITEEGVRTNIRVSILYLEAWLRGYGAVPIHNLMEDAATAEISRAQIWQWIRHPEGALEDGRKITWEMIQQMIDEEKKIIQQEVSEEKYQSGKYEEAIEIFTKVVQEDEFESFLTIPAYSYI